MSDFCSVIAVSSNTKKQVNLQKPKTKAYVGCKTNLPIFEYGKFDNRYNLKNVVEGAKSKIDIKSKNDVAYVTGLSRECIDRITKYETLSTKAYKGAAGDKLIGYGHKIKSDKDYHYGDKITEQQAMKLLAKDLKYHKDMILKSVEKNLNQGQLEALVDISYNMGFNGLKETKLFELVKKGKFEQAMHEFDIVYIHGKHISTSLVKRRMEDLNAFVSSKHTSKSKAAINEIARKGVKSLDRRIAQSRRNRESFKNQKQDIWNELTSLLSPMSRQLTE